MAGAIGDRQGLTPGHESVGVIYELGDLAAASGLFKVGQRVSVRLSRKLPLLASTTPLRQLSRLRQQRGKLDLLILDGLGYVPASEAGAKTIVRCDRRSLQAE